MNEQSNNHTRKQANRICENIKYYYFYEMCNDAHFWNRKRCKPVSSFINLSFGLMYILKNNRPATFLQIRLMHLGLGRVD